MKPKKKKAKQIVGSETKQMRWRRKNLDKHRAYHKKYMVAWRAKQKAASEGVLTIVLEPQKEA